ncbi:hypothetical protein PsAD2_02981 [Pseudovibrio axinellae]|uniref:Uncharacterized protein n=1 Tax=Pseudovibrio axinellae TaxID=989403 RepID=A0A165XF17_9HYPH|nr:hypothetical protein [Pseudovibrio axinellae]KZL17645.1 hypothetical protein PsAD2_02981 [Pseudovibrio axinellae]SER45132.1 hypothetical protein SAMN05421798_110101 [Pseudovibrio axinellae]
MYLKLVSEDLDLQKKDPLPIEDRFMQLVEWAEDEGIEVLLFSFIKSRFDKIDLEDLSAREKEITYEHNRRAVVMTRYNRCHGTI